ncbi:MAG: hypothetical protein KY395_06195 [Actinobacteria bacterium]|nr:hypothetical protein [Actinomycetota bacterium]
MISKRPVGADGTGLTVVVNPSAGPALGRAPTDVLRDELPGAIVVELDEASSLDDELAKAAEVGATALGVAGGDGSVNAAAAVAMTRDLPLLIVPTGTLNHLARDLGIYGVEEAVSAVRAGTVQGIDVGRIDGRPFLNTASIGSYVELVDRRERLESRIGKWPAFVVAFVALLFHAEPEAVEIDGLEHRVWVAFFGNCLYNPKGIAPRARVNLDDGLLDVRILEARHGWERIRLLAAGVLGRTEHARGFEQRSARQIRIRASADCIRLARDGETFDGSRAFEVKKSPKALNVLVPPDTA